MLVGSNSIKYLKYCMERGYPVTIKMNDKSTAKIYFHKDRGLFTLNIYGITDLEQFKKEKQEGKAIVPKNEGVYEI